MNVKKLIKFFQKVTTEGMEFDVKNKTEEELIKNLKSFSHRDLVLWLSEQMKVLWLVLEFKKISMKECRNFLEENHEFINNHIKSKLTSILNSLLS